MAKKPFKAQLFSRWGMNARMVSKACLIEYSSRVGSACLLLRCLLLSDRQLGLRYAVVAKTKLYDVPLYWDGGLASLSRRFPGVGGWVGSVSTEVVPLTVLDSAYRGTLVLQSLYPFFLQLYK